MGQYIHAQKAAVLTIFHCFICCTAVQAQLPDPVSMWRFEEGSGNTAVDTGAGGYHGRLVGDVFFVQDDERGSVLEFGSSETQFNQGPGAEGYEYNTTIDLGDFVVKYVKINIHSGWGPLGKYSLSEVRFFSIPVHARKHEPTDGAVDVGTAALLTWRAGREAGSHDVYLDTDEQAVRDGTAPVVTVTETSTMMDLDLGHTYFWKVNEVNSVEDPAIWEGDTLRFSTRAYLVVDDFEMYADMESKEIWAFWTDGYDDPGNGSLVGYGDIGERTIVHGGNQSMPLAYSNAGGATHSKTIRYFDDPQDWTMGGAQTLVLYFYGAPDNTGQLSVKVNNRTEITYGGSADAIATAEWTQWTIDLDSLGTDLKRVTEMSIGVQTGSGLVLIDDIRLYRIAPGLGTE